MDVAKISSGLMFNPLQKRKILHTGQIVRMGQVGCRNNFVSYHGYSKNLILQHKLYSSGLTTRSSVVTRASNGSTDPAPKSGFSFNIIDILVFILKIPVIVLGFLRKDKKLIEKIEDRLDDAAETVGNIAEAIEDVAEVVEKVAENIAEDAKEARELMDKVEETTASMRSDIDTAADRLQGACEPGKAKDEKASTADIDAAAKATSKAAQKAKGVKEAVKELQEKELPVKEKEVKEVPTGKFQAVDVTDTTSKRLRWAVMLAMVAVLISNWWLPQFTYGSLLKYLSDLILDKKT